MLTEEPCDVDGQPVEGDQEETVEGDQEESVGGDQEESVGGDQEESVAADKTKSVEADKTESVEADKTESVEADQIESVEADQEESVEGDQDMDDVYNLHEVEPDEGVLDGGGVCVWCQINPIDPVDMGFNTCYLCRMIFIGRNCFVKTSYKTR